MVPLVLLALALPPQQPLDHLLHVEPAARSRRASSASPDPDSNADNLRVPPGREQLRLRAQGEAS